MDDFLSLIYLFLITRLNVILDICNAAKKKKKLFSQKLNDLSISFFCTNSIFIKNQHYLLNRVAENIIGAPKIQNNYGEIKMLLGFFSVLLPI